MLNFLVIVIWPLNHNSSNLNNLLYEKWPGKTSCLLPNDDEGCWGNVKADICMEDEICIKMKLIYSVKKNVLQRQNGDEIDYTREILTINWLVQSIRNRVTPVAVRY